MLRMIRSLRPTERRPQSSRWAISSLPYPSIFPNATAHNSLPQAGGGPAVAGP